MLKFLKKFICVIIIFIAFFTFIKNINSTKNNERKLIFSDNKSKYTVDNLMLVNRSHPISKDFVPDDLTVPDVNFSPDISDEEKMMSKNASKAIEKLFKAAEEDNINLYCVSGYRSYYTQKTIYQNRVDKVGKAAADEYVATPGHSEHQTGLAMDVTNEKGIKNELTGDFGNTKEGKWLKSKASKYGFIIRYPRGKEDITGYGYEPWHIRYVGADNSKDIKDKGLVLEEYLKDYKSASN